MMTDSRYFRILSLMAIAISVLALPLASNQVVWTILAIAGVLALISISVNEPK
jgi:hypothetical protein